MLAHYECKKFHYERPFGLRSAVCGPDHMGELAAGARAL